MLLSFSPDTSAETRGQVGRFTAVRLRHIHQDTRNSSFGICGHGDAAMAKRPGTDDGMLTSPTRLRDFAANLSSGNLLNMDCGDGAEEVSLEEILSLYSQPINEEQAWAVCYQCCRTLAQRHRRKSPKSAVASAAGWLRRIEGPGDVRIGRDGAVELRFEDSADEYTSAPTSLEVIDSLGVMIYKALDFGLKENEERELSPPLERLIDMMTNNEETENDPCPDEGYEATEEEDECEGEEEEEEEEELVSTSTTGTVGSIRGYRDIILICSSHLPSPSDAPSHYQAVCRALYAETRELRTFLEKIKNAKENLRKMEGETREEAVKDLDDLQNADWARFWVQVMRDLRDGVKLKKVQERQYNPLPIEYQLTPYEMLMDDIRSQRYKLRKVMVNGDLPPRLKKSAHEVILEFIRSRPPLNPVAARKLKPHPVRPRSLHERLLEDIKAERKLRPVSPDMIRRTRLGAGKSISTPQDLFRSSDTPDAPRKLAVSTQSLAGSTKGPSQGGGVQPLCQRKRLLKAPTLAELDSSESDEETTQSSSSMSTSLMEDTSPESVTGKKAPPNFLPISATPQPDKRRSPRRRHTLEKDAPTSVRPFRPPSRQSSKSLVEAASGAQGSEEFCYPAECLALTVEEVMHIRQVLVKAELEKFQQYKEIYNALKKGKLCFSCRTKRFSLFTWSYTCQFCKRPVCSQCCKKMRLPSKPYSTLPIYSLGPSAVAKDEARDASAAEPEKNPFGSGQIRHSLRRSVSKSSKHGGGSSSKDERPEGEPELPKELTEDWVAMEVCVDCKKFITEIIASSRRSLCVASKRARLNRNRKTQSFYMSSSNSVNFRPSERTINEV
ncbi:protein spire homolog 1 isoform X5 [Platichthys flesus]|uniref:protein spire homolog 1 isoform X5 n=1 Tax=Platichthys flesus TaxID=8260 RepID=UPI002DBDDB56|nr:protein spire homolog 1 isoform X5 [Platichthys flesus]